MPLALADSPALAVRSGLAIAAAICLVSGLVAEGLAGALGRTSPLGAMLLGMMVRMVAAAGRLRRDPGRTGRVAASIWPSSATCWRFIWSRSRWKRGSP